MQTDLRSTNDLNFFLKKENGENTILAKKSIFTQDKNLSSPNMRIIAATAAIFALATAVLAELNPAFHAEAPTGKAPAAGEHKKPGDRFNKIVEEFKERHHARFSEENKDKPDDLEVKPL